MPSICPSRFSPTHHSWLVSPWASCPLWLPFGLKEWKAPGYSLAFNPSFSRSFQAEVTVTSSGCCATLVGPLYPTHRWVGRGARNPQVAASAASG